MLSPKFKFSRKELEETFDRSLLRQEWKKRVGAQIRKQILVDTIEFRDYTRDIDAVISGLRQDVLSGRYYVHENKRYLVEKSRGLCRMMTLVHPRDLLALERLSRSIHFELKRKAPSRSAFFEPDEGNFKEPFKKYTDQYGSFASWKRFQREIFGFARECNYIVVTDIANFFDFISFRHLRNVVSSLTDIRESNLDLLLHVLSQLAWTPDFMPRVDVGMPQIETTATRVLANAMLYELDRVCEDHAISNYARFMDDIDAGCESLPHAKRFVRDVDLTLQSRQLRLNSSKTQIMKRKEAFHYFCIEENEYLAKLAEAAKAAKHHRWLRSYCLRRAVAKYEEWLDRQPSGGPAESSPFLNGNGSKIHKWIISIIYGLGGDVPNNDLLWLVRMKPAMREMAFHRLSYSKSPNSALAELERMVRRKTFIDDAALVYLSHFALHARFKRTGKATGLLRSLAKAMERSGELGLHCAILLSSRVLPHDEIVALLRRNIRAIRSDYWLSRAAGGIGARFFSSGPHFPVYRDLIRDLNSDAAFATYNYMQSLYTGPGITTPDVRYLTSENTHYPHGIFYPKVLVALSYLSGAPDKALDARIRTAHPALDKDPFYKSMGF